MPDPDGNDVTCTLQIHTTLINNDLNSKFFDNSVLRQTSLTGAEEFLESLNIAELRSSVMFESPVLETDRDSKDCELRSIAHKCPVAGSFKLKMSSVSVFVV
ncbi:hypothetical protein T265_07363 [Opisthorchis viverrini]|uniref:Uncharacterized protein n=1 Tax=Opisthorchis viverrini TaxID=6198 RepID=A0A074ZD78_OPIVI|nr:hypothetical protein T265_07363 [Opisthorchis viverrini]KER25143.1 hypothetical protein T265_07363 [Opisthorchis viverrini]